MGEPTPKRFGNDPALRSHKFPEKLVLREVGGNLEAMWKDLTLRVGCDECQAVAGDPCISLSQKTPGKELEGFHAPRYKEAKQKYGRKDTVR